MRLARGIRICVLNWGIFVSRLLGVLLRSDTGDVASGADYRGGCHRWQLIDALEDAWCRKRPPARERRNPRLHRRAGRKLVNGEDLAGIGLRARTEAS